LAQGMQPDRDEDALLQAGFEANGAGSAMLGRSAC